VNQEAEIALISKVKALLHLLEDDSPVVREAVTVELRAPRLDITSFLQENMLELSDAQYGVLDGIFRDKYRAELLLDWEMWLDSEEDPNKLETAMALLDRFQNGTRPIASLPEMLDNLASLMTAGGEMMDHRKLAWRLFHDYGFSAVPEGQERSEGLNLTRVIEQRCGLPVSLVCVYLLLGKRFGLESSGCNWPGSCYVRYAEGDDLHVIDCSNHGVIQSVEELLRLQGPSRNAAESIITMEMPPSVLVRRILSKLSAYYRREGHAENSMLAIELLRMVDRRLRQSEMRGTAVS